VVTADHKLKYFRHAPIETINSASGNQVERADIELGAFFRNMKTRKGSAPEATATAGKIARIYYTLVKKGDACWSYLDFYHKPVKTTPRKHTVHL